MTPTENTKRKEEIGRMEKMAESAKTSWFWFFGILGYIAVTTFGLTDGELFSTDSTAKLPILDFLIDLRSFYTFAPLIIVAIYSYLHGQIFLLSTSLFGIADPTKADTSDNLRLTELPIWFVIEFAISIRAGSKSMPRDVTAKGAASARLLIISSVGAIIWFLAPLIITWIWWKLLVLHLVWLSLLHVSCIFVCIIAGWTSWRKLKGGNWTEDMISMGRGLGSFFQSNSLLQSRFCSCRACAGLAVISVALGVVTLQRTGKWPAFLSSVSLLPVAKARLSEDALRSTAATWIPRQIALRIYFDEWCRRADTVNCVPKVEGSLDLLDTSEFQEEFAASRSAYLAGFKQIRLNSVSLDTAGLDGANLAGSILEDVNLDDASLKGAIFEGARLVSGSVSGADFSEADLRGATISSRADRMVDFSNANLELSQLSISGLGGVDLHGANLSNSFLTGPMSGDFSFANLTNVNFVGTFSGYFDFVDHNPSSSAYSLSGEPWRTSFQDSLVSFPPDAFRGKFLWQSASVVEKSGSTHDVTLYFGLSGTAIQEADFSEVNRLVLDGESIEQSWDRTLRNSFGNLAHVVLPPEARRPCQWVSIQNDPVKFISTWRAWLERGNKPWPPFPGLERLQSSISKDGQDQLINFAQIPADDSLLPPKEQCDWSDDR
jgi:uncharacterized protein YjbI with pentapeptide repeats